MSISSVCCRPLGSASNGSNPRSIRVLHVEAGTYFGGSHKALATYLKGSRNPDLQHHVLLVHPVPEFEAMLRGICPLTTLPNGPVPLFQPPSGKPAILRFWAAQTQGIWRFLLSRRFDLVHVNNTFTFQPYTVVASRLAGVPAVVHMRNPVPESRLARLIAYATRMIVPQNAALGRSIQHWRKRDVKVCYDGIEPGVADEVAARQLRESLLGSGTVLIGSVGRLEHQKGYDLFIEAAKELASVDPGVRFAIAGEGPLRSQLERRLRELGLHHNFHLCGFRSDVATFLRALDIFVCSSRYEGGPYTVAEALLAGKPVISTPVGFVPELSSNGQYADLVPIEDVTALVAAMQRAIAANDVPVSTAKARDCVIHFSNPLLAAERFDTLLLEAGREK